MALKKPLTQWFIVTKKLINTDVRLGENTLLLEALESLGIDFPIDWGNNWVKWNSGRLECWGSVAQAIAINTSSGAMFKSADIRTNFPVTFISTPTDVSPTFYRHDRSGNAVLLSKTTSGFNWHALITESFGAGYEWLMSYHAIGRWK